MAAASDLLAGHGIERDRRTVRGAQLKRSAAVAVLALLAALLAGCASANGSSRTPHVALPPVGAAPDYQLGGAYPPAPGVGVVGRDRSDPPGDGVYSICYVNGFQTQPSELDSWPEELLLTRDGSPVFDPDWPDEVLLDTSTSENRQRIADVVEPWIAECADGGFEAVEFDNLDSYTRSDGALTLDDNLALATVFVDLAHEAGLAAGQKNAAEDAEALHDRAGFDFAVVEECAAYEECDAYSEVYGDHVIDIEYTDELPRSFAEMCADDRSPASMVLRDRDLRVEADAEHVFEVCP